MAAPLKYKEYCIVEKAPSHDGAPTFTSYWSQPPVHNEPRDVAAALAEAIHKGTWSYRSTHGRGTPDRVEVVKLPMPADVTDEERTLRCREHNKAEVAYRAGDAPAGWLIPANFRLPPYQRTIFVIDSLMVAENLGTELSVGLRREREDIGFSMRGYLSGLRREDPSERASDPCGSFLTVEWGLVPRFEDEEDLPECAVRGHALSRLDSFMARLREQIEWLPAVVADGEGN